MTRVDEHGRRLYLGEEFYERGISKDSRLLTRCQQLNKRVKANGIIDEKVYVIADDPKEEHSVALSKNGFADYILNENEYANGFDFSSFRSIFDVIKQICEST